MAAIPYLAVALISTSIGAVLCLKMYRGSLLAPPVIIGISFAISSLLGLSGLLSWNTEVPSFIVTSVIIVGIASFSLGSAVITLVSNRRVCARHFRHAEGLNDAHPCIWKIAIASMLVIFSIALHIYEMYQIAGELGYKGGSFSEAMYLVRENTENIFDPVSSPHGFTFFERQLGKLSTAIAYISCFLFVKTMHTSPGNRLARFKNASPYLLLYFLSLVRVFVSGGRARFAYTAIALVVFHFLIIARTRKEYGSLSVDLLKTVAPFGAAVFVAFIALGPLIGRSTTLSVLEYPSFYFGCGIPSFQHLMRNGLPLTWPGEHTFYGLFSLLGKMGLPFSETSFSPAWVKIGGHWSNVFTCFYVYYAEFGLAGVVILSTLAGVISTTIYQKALNKPTFFWILLYGYLAPYLVDSIREEFVFSRLFSTNVASILILEIVVYLFFNFGFRLSNGKS